MKRIDDRTVEFTSAGEERAKELFDEYLDRGHGIPMAAKLALNRTRGEGALSVVTPAFVEYLSEGTCRIWGGRVLVKKEWQ